MVCLCSPPPTSGLFAPRPASLHRGPLPACSVPVWKNPAQGCLGPTALPCSLEAGPGSSVSHWAPGLLELAWRSDLRLEGGRMGGAGWGSRGPGALEPHTLPLQLSQSLFERQGTPRPGLLPGSLRKGLRTEVCRYGWAGGCMGLGWVWGWVRCRAGGPCLSPPFN